jgi:hypothetical protein
MAKLSPVERAVYAGRELLDCHRNGKGGLEDIYVKRFKRACLALLTRDDFRLVEERLSHLDSDFAAAIRGQLEERELERSRRSRPSVLAG